MTMNDAMSAFTTSAVNVVGTYLCGYVKATRRELETVFGAPTFEGDDPYEKVTTEWGIRFPDGTVSTIYDWKRYEMGAPGMDEVVSWHIGGRGEASVVRVGEVSGLPVVGEALVTLPDLS